MTDLFEKFVNSLPQEEFPKIPDPLPLKPDPEPQPRHSAGRGYLAYLSYTHRSGVRTGKGEPEREVVSDKAVWGLVAIIVLIIFLFFVLPGVIV